MRRRLIENCDHNLVSQTQIYTPDTDDVIFCPTLCYALNRHDCTRSCIPESEAEARDSCISVVEEVVADGPPGTGIVDFQTTFSVVSYQSQCPI